MDIDPRLFNPEATESLEMALLKWSQAVMETDELGALNNLFELVRGYADRLEVGMTAVGFSEEDASETAWKLSWSKLRGLLDRETQYTPELAAYIERNLAQLLPDQQYADHGEPLDYPTRAFYKVFIERIESPAVNNRAAWLTS